MTKKLTLILLALAAAGTAFGAPIVYFGSTIGDPDPGCLGCTTGSWNRPEEELQFLSGFFGTNVPYHAFPFTVTEAGLYSFFSDTFVPDQAEWDNFLILYDGGFADTDPLSFAVVANDNFDFTLGWSGFVSPLSVGSTYYLVTTGFDDFDAGDFTNTITLQASAIPEPAAFWLLGLGLAGLGAVGRRLRRT